MDYRNTKGFRGHRLYAVTDEVARGKTYGQGRVCMVEGCGTLLSSYNPSSVCALHGGGWHDEFRHNSRKKRTREEFARVCSYDACGREFVTANPAKKYCSDSCRMKAFQARTVAARRLEVAYESMNKAS